MMRGQITLEQGHIICLAKDRLCLIISHDCDIAHQDEPFVEIIELSQIEKIDGNRTKAKNVRELHIEHEHQLYRLTASTKESLNKEDLNGVVPMSCLNAANLRILQKWLSCRYKRHSIPEELNSIVRPVFEELAKKIKDTEDAIDGVFIAYEEIDPENYQYEISIKVVFDSQKESGYAKATSLSEQFDAKLRKSQISLNSCDAVPDYEFTLADIKSFVEYRLDFLCD